MIFSRLDKFDGPILEGTYIRGRGWGGGGGLIVGILIEFGFHISGTYILRAYISEVLTGFELGIFTFNLYVYNLTRGVIASTCTLSFPIRAFGFLTRAFEPVTRRFEVVTSGFEHVTYGFELVTRVFPQIKFSKKEV